MNAGLVWQPSEAILTLQFLVVGQGTIEAVKPLSGNRRDGGAVNGPATVE